MKREIGWGFFLAGLPFAPFLVFGKLDLWHAQALWAQGWVIALFALGFSQRPVHLNLMRNLPLTWTTLWVGLSALWLWTTIIIVHKTYPSPMLFGLFHLLCGLLFYQAALRDWTSMSLTHLLRWIAIAGAVLVVYGVFQLLTLDQFFNVLGAPEGDALVGTMGNSSHFGSYLAFLLPIFWIQEGRVWRVVWGVAVLLLVLTKSAGGCLAAWVAMNLLWWSANRTLCYVSLGLGVFAGVVLGVIGGDFYNLHGRLEAWKVFGKVFQEKPLTGLGAGFVAELARATPQGSPIFQWRHVHNEYFQMAIEFGLIGLAGVLWMLGEAFKTAWRLPKLPVVLALRSVLIGFCVNSLVNFPAHLWQLASFGLLAYSGIYAVASEQQS